MTALRVAGASYLVLGIGFGAGAVVTLLHFARHRVQIGVQTVSAASS